MYLKLLGMLLIKTLAAILEDFPQTKPAEVFELFVSVSVDSLGGIHKGNYNNRVWIKSAIQLIVYGYEWCKSF